LGIKHRYTDLRMNDEQIIEAKIARYMAEAGGDPRGAMRLMAIDLHRYGGLVSSGLVGAPRVVPSRLPPKAQVEAIDIPASNSPEAASPLS
jgi:hypothetical protein